MSTLEDMLPELAGVFAAQESAMENVMSMLTTQVAQLIQENDRQSHRVASLESTQQQLQDALLTLRKAYNSLEDRQKCERVEIVDAIGGVASDVVQLQAKVESELAAFDAKVQSVMAKPEPVVTTVVAGPSESQVVGLLNEHLASMESKLLNEHLAPLESKLTADTDRRMLEVANQSFLQAQQTEEAMKTELEMLEKKFDYLSRVKTEIKDLGKRIDKQDQTLDGMRMGMELLSKSIGTDEVNESDSDDTDHDEDRQEPLRLRVDKAEEMNIMKRISLSSADIQAKIDKNAAALLAEATASTPPEPVEVPPPPRTPVRTRLKRSKSLAAARGQQALFSRSKTVGRGAMNPAPLSANDTLVANIRRSASDGSEESDQEEPAPVPGEVEDMESSVTAESTAPPPEDTAAEVNLNEFLEEVVEVSGVESLPDVASDDVGSATLVEGNTDLAGAAELSLEDDHPVADAAPDPIPEKSPEEADTALEEAEEHDQVVDILPSQTSRSRLTSRELPQQQLPLETAIEIKTPSRPASPVATIHHMPTTPNLPTTPHSAVSTASTAIIRSRRTSRQHKRTSSLRLKEPTDTARSELRTPMAKETIKELWCRMFARFVQLKRLQLLNGANPERIFRKQNVSVGARVKRLEESATDLEELVEVLEGSIQQNSQGVQALTLMLAQTRLDLNARIDHLNEDRIMQGQMVVGLEEKLDVIEIDLRRVRGSSRRESTQSTSNATVNALTTQQQELALQFTDHAAAFEAVERAVKRLCELDLPAATAKFETAMRDFRGEQAYKSKELAKDLRKTIDRVQKMQTAAQANLQKRTNSLVERLYRDLMTLSKAHLVSLEMVRAVKTPSSATSAPATSDASAGGKKDAVLFDVSLDMLTNVFANFRDDCKAATNLDRDDEDRRDTSPLSALLERATNFQSELERLREQAEKAKRSPVLAFGGEDSSSANFIDRLALVTTAQLRALESLDNSSLRGDSREGDDDATSSDVSLRVQDLVVQLRAVSSLLSLHAELIDPHQRLRAVLSAHDALQKEVRGHDYAIAQFNTAGAMVKTMNARLDSFLELSFSFAKDEDVKKSIEEMLSSSESVRDNVAEQLEAAHAEALQRDERLEHELTQLVARVNKKLDKDELLWTQEVIERQLQSVAKSSLGENDLADIHRLLRNKLDKSYFNTLLLEQRDRAAGSGGGGGAAVGGGGAPGSTPLIGAKCMSCNSEMPPTKAMIQSIVKEQVQLEVHKTLARQQQAPPSATPASPASFNVSTHRSMDKYKKELMAAAAQSPQKPQARR